MPRAVQFWQDNHGFLHDTEQGASNADEAFERVGRREVVRGMLLTRIRETRGDEGWPFHASGDLADWLIVNWPALKAIGYAFRLDDFASGAQALPERVA